MQYHKAIHQGTQETLRGDKPIEEKSINCVCEFRQNQGRFWWSCEIDALVDYTLRGWESKRSEGILQCEGYAWTGANLELGRNSV